MRYMVQFLVPALIVVTVVYLLARTKRGQDEADEGTDDGSDTGTFILILVVGATVAVLSFFLLQGYFG
jgi:hypothetical protein